MADDATIGADEVARKQFGTAFRGFDQNEVRAFLARVAGELGTLHERERSLRERVARAESRPTAAEASSVDLEAMLGAETTRVLHAAREAAAEIRARAEEHVARLLREANDEAARLRSEAETVHARHTEEAEAAANAIRDAVEGAAASLRADAEARAAATVDEAQQRGRDMVNEAQAVRERVLKDLARRRRSAAMQLEQLRAGRERLLEAYELVRRTLDEATTELTVAEREAQLASDAARLRPPPDDEQIERDLADSASDLPASVEPEPEPEPEPEVERAHEPDAEPAPRPITRLPEPAPEPARQPEPPGEERRSSSLRLLRRKPEPVVLAPPLDEDVESVRIIRPEPAPDAAEPAPSVAAVTDLRPLAPPDETVSAPESTGVAESDTEPETVAVDDLFARLRADRAAALAQAEAVLAEQATVLAGPEPTEGEADATPVATEDPALVVSAEDSVFERRDGAIEELERLLTKALKRVLADEQNEVLDAQRRLRAAPQLESLLPGADAHRARFAVAAREHLAGAAAAGAASLDGAAGDTERLADSLGAALADDVRTRLGRALESSTGDDEALLEAISAIYREWKTSRAEACARHHVAAAYAQGAFAAVPEGELRWAVDPTEGGCPDCDDNALAGPTPKGTAFPTGQQHPPAHTGCRCMVLPIV